MFLLYKGEIKTFKEFEVWARCCFEYLDMRREEVLIWWGDVDDSGVWMYRDKLGKWDNKGEVREQ